MKILSSCSILFVLALASCAGMSTDSTKPAGRAIEEVKEVLEDFRLAKAELDAERFYAHLADDAMVLGTDAPERWTVEELRALMGPWFERETGWMTSATAQHVIVDEGGRLAWFDEVLESEAYGTMRSSGVLRREGDAWKIVQYNTVFLVPNELALEYIEKAKAVRAG
jgi:ketosteroid isomerase-like protein